MRAVAGKLPTFSLMYVIVYHVSALTIILNRQWMFHSFSANLMTIFIRQSLCSAFYKGMMRYRKTRFVIMSNFSFSLSHSRSKQHRLSLTHDMLIDCRSNYFGDIMSHLVKKYLDSLLDSGAANSMKTAHRDMIPE